MGKNKILDLIEAGDGEAAIAAAKHHLDGIETALNAQVLLGQPSRLVDKLKINFSPSSLS